MIIVITKPKPLALLRSAIAPFTLQIPPTTNKKKIELPIPTFATAKIAVAIINPPNKTPIIFRIIENVLLVFCFEEVPFGIALIFIIYPNNSTTIKRVSIPATVAYLSIFPTTYHSLFPTNTVQNVVITIAINSITIKNNSKLSA